MSTKITISKNSLLVQRIDRNYDIVVIVIIINSVSNRIRNRHIDIERRKLEAQSYYYRSSSLYIGVVKVLSVYNIIEKTLH